MMARILVTSMRQVCKVQSRQASNVPPLFYGQMHGDVYWGGKKYNKIGDREIVGHGFNGEPSYIDCSECPFPAIRYKEVTPDIKALREKEKGDWSKLSIEDKKALYRASFRQTFAEFEANLGDWKGCVGYALMMACVGIWAFVSFKVFIAPPLPESLSREHQLRSLEKMRILDVEPIKGTIRKLYKDIE